MILQLRINLFPFVCFCVFNDGSMCPLLGGGASGLGFLLHVTQVCSSCLALISPVFSQPCWNEYLTTRIEQNMVLSCTCPISECCAQPTTAFICSIVSSKEVIAKVRCTRGGYWVSKLCSILVTAKQIILLLLFSITYGSCLFWCGCYFFSLLSVFSYCLELNPFPT